jgi:hypothetical protein
MFASNLRAGKSLNGYVDKGLVEIQTIVSRHYELSEELQKRGMKHNSPIEHLPGFGGYIDKEKSLQELQSRCMACRRLRHDWEILGHI